MTTEQATQASQLRREQPATPQPGQGSELFNRLRQMVDNLTVALTNDSIYVGFLPRQILLAELNDLCVALDSPPVAALQSPLVATAQQSEAPALPMLFRSDDEEHPFGYGMSAPDTHPAIAELLGAFQVVRAHPATERSAS